LAVLTKGKSSEEKAKWTADLTECLRAYDILGLWRDAEEILRRQLVVGFVKKVSITAIPGPEPTELYYGPYFLAPF
jgi:hypothetical protein